jgi:hypothetical protein
MLHYWTITTLVGPKKSYALMLGTLFLRIPLTLAPYSAPSLMLLQVLLASMRMALPMVMTPSAIRLKC